MPNLTLQTNPSQLVLGPLREQQLCYLLLTISARGSGTNRPVNWALIADASRSMRIPIVDEAQFRALLREHAAQETLVDGVPVWQLSGPVPPEVRAASPSALDHVARALHSIVERLDRNDRFALIACAEEAVLLNRSASGTERRIRSCRCLTRRSRKPTGMMYAQKIEIPMYTTSVKNFDPDAMTYVSTGRTTNTAT